MNYFAYGSNMSLARLRSRVPSARSLGLGILEQHQLRFHKLSKDGSAKCDAFLTGEPLHQVFGVLYRIEAEQKPLLDEVEGVGQGYEEKAISIIDTGGNLSSAFTYYATHIDDTLLPYSWYLNHVLIGAKEASLPEGYIAELNTVATIDDQDLQRSQQELSIHLPDGERIKQFGNGYTSSG
ncbi:MAG: gamma-glutamylcyclotransferase [Gammaproteobacteria bacterium]|nr:gamma-glutamylcyclotransferase [Gammaproteobacteria bacterium]